MGPGDIPLPGRAGSDSLAEESTHRDPATHDIDQAQRQNHTVDHEYARLLIEEQTRRQLPPAEANALADHLLICDRCFRYAQDVAARERQRASEHP